MAGSAPPNMTFSPGRFEVVVGDLERTGAIPAGDRLRVGARFLEVGEIRVDDGGLARVHRDAASRASYRISVQIAAIEDDVVRQRARLGLVPPELHELVKEYAVCGGNLEADEAVMMCAALGVDHGAGRGDELGERGDV